MAGAGGGPDGPCREQVGGLKRCGAASLGCSEKGKYGVTQRTIRLCNSPPQDAMSIFWFQVAFD